MSIPDRLLLAIAAFSGSVSCWLVFLSLTQVSLRPTASPSNITFLMVVSSTIVAILLKRKGLDNPGRLATQRRTLLGAGAVGAFVLMLFTKGFADSGGTGSESVTIAHEATLAGYAGVGLLTLFLKISYDRISRESEDELAPGTNSDGPASV